MAGYIRQSTYTDGDIIQAADSNDEFDQLVAAFHNSTGHSHDGTAAEGPVIGLIGDPGASTPLNKVVVNDTSNQVEFSIDVTGVSTQQIIVKDGVIQPTTNNDIDLGTSSIKFKDGYFAGNLTVDGNIALGGNITIGDADTDSVTVNADVDSSLVPNVDNTYDLGSATKEWRNLYVDGTANIDSLVADTADINAGTIDNTVIGGTTPVAATFTTITANSTAAITGNTTVGGTLGVTGATTLSSTADITGNTTVGGTLGVTGATTLSSTLGVTGNTTVGGTLGVTGNTTVGGTLGVTGNQTNTGNLTVNGNTTLGNAATDTVTITADVASNVIPSADDTYDLGAVGSEWKNIYIDGTAFIDNLTIGTSTGITSVDTDLTTVSASDDTLASAKAIKAYVDSQVTAQDLDFQGDAGGALSIDLDSETLTIAGGTGISTTGSGNTLTVDIDSTVATLTGVQTLTNKTLTSPDVNGGTVDGAIIGGTTPAAITGTTVTATSFVGPLTGNVTGNVTGTVSDISNHTTTDLTEGTNLYYTQARFDTAFTGKSTTDLTEGTNLYYTTARVNLDIDTRVDKTFVDNLNVDAATLGGASQATILATAEANALALSIALG